MNKRKLIAAVLLAIAAVPWLLTFDWRPMLIGVLAAVASVSIVFRPGLARLAVPVVCGVSWVIFFIAGLHREGIDIAGHSYIAMQLLTPFSTLSLILYFFKEAPSDPGDIQTKP
ncbi:MAG: hypothetical protein COA78_18750 [Blastopirellula sp.]|nr:MAG: hypothetical protein COA78_18750 [Blastopirellula sp.]